MVELLKAVEEGILVVLRTLHGLGEFMMNPGEGSAIAFTWIFGPLLAFAGTQKIKRMVLDFNVDPPGWVLEWVGTMSCAFICWVLLAQLWEVESKIWVHIFLISWFHMVSTNAWMNFLRRYCPILFKSFRSKRRSVDAPSRVNDPKGYDRYNADPDVTMDGVPNKDFLEATRPPKGGPDA